VSPAPARPRLLFLHLHPSPFVLEDLSILQDAFAVRVFHFRSGGGGAQGLLRLMAAFARELFWLLREWRAADIVFGWFADYHLLLPVLMSRLWRRPLVVVLGGFESNHLPELSYGAFHSRWRAPLARSVLRQAALLLPVSSSLIEAEESYSLHPLTRRNGIKTEIPDLSTPIVTVPTGYIVEDWPMGPPARSASVCSVAGLSNARTVKVKGIDILIETARRLPEVQFRVVGVAEDLREMLRRRDTPPPNVEFLPARPRDELRELYGRTSVYLQLSRTEGLPNALCEAMLCGCIPVVSAVGGMPEAVGDVGFVAQSPEPKAIAELVRRAVAEGSDPITAPGSRARARERIVVRYPFSQRRQQLLALLLDRIRDQAGPRVP
jgi:glycosyltransferase involved in cell wall biosynthesis